MPNLIGMDAEDTVPFSATTNFSTKRLKCADPITFFMKKRPFSGFHIMEKDENEIGGPKFKLIKISLNAVWV